MSCSEDGKSKIALVLQVIYTGNFCFNLQVFARMEGRLALLLQQPKVSNLLCRGTNYLQVPESSARSAPARARNTVPLARPTHDFNSNVIRKPLPAL